MELPLPPSLPLAGQEGGVVAVIPEAAAVYRRHRAWRLAGRPPDKCRGPTATDIIDADLANRGIVNRIERDREYTILAQAVLDMVEPERMEPTRHRSNIQHSPTETIDVNDLPYGGRFSHKRGE